ncbi:MAG TPA: conjugative transposon protein TraJ [Mucilaginibacter sp.]|nr:conjugative transposon protein TraJ [Mucilaginibacter sp.]
MRTSTIKVALVATIATLLPLFSHAQGTANSIHSLQSILDGLYDQMMPLCKPMINIGRGIAGLAALTFIAVRVWRHVASAEPIDFYPLLRPFAIGMVIMAFPAFLSLINGVLQPTVTATAAMVGNANGAIEVMLNEDQPSAETMSAPANTDPDKWYQYTHPDNTSASGTNSTTMADQFSGWGFKNAIKKAIYQLLNVCFEAAALCIDTIRIFKLIVLAILGPLAFGLGVFDGFQHTIRQWIARYINVYLWLPVANIFGAIISNIQLNMTHMQASGANSQLISDTNSAYMVFLLIGIVGYFTVPAIAGYIVNAGSHALLSKTSAMTSMAMGAITNKMMYGGNSGGSSQSFGQYFKEGYEGKDGGSGVAGALGRSIGRSGFMADRLSGKSTS